MQSVIKDTTIVNKAHISIQLESRDDIENFKELLRLADNKLRDKYVGGGEGPVKTMIEELKDKMQKAGL